MKRGSSSIETRFPEAVSFALSAEYERFVATAVEAGVPPGRINALIHYLDRGGDEGLQAVAERAGIHKSNLLQESARALDRLQRHLTRKD